MTIATIVADLDAGTVVGLGRPAGGDSGSDAPLSTSHAIKWRFTNVRASISTTNRLGCDEANDISVNGTYLHFADNWSTICRLDALRPLVISGAFSGCAFKVYRGGGSFIAAHIARPAGPSADANVALMDDYASQKGWVEVQDIRTSGVVGTAGATTCAVVSQLRGNQIDTIRLGLNGTGQTVARQRFTVAV